MAKKSKRASKTSSGVGKNRAGKNVARRAPATADPAGMSFIRHQAAGRWPMAESEHRYFELNNSKDAVNRPANRIKPPALGMPLLESIDPRTLDILLTAASLTVKRVKRYPGWILQQTYNLKNRPIQII